MTNNAQLMEITARTVKVARYNAVNDEQLRILNGIKEITKRSNLTPESRLLIHEIYKLVRD